MLSSEPWVVASLLLAMKKWHPNFQPGVDSITHASI